MPITSRFYLTRPADAELAAAITRRDSIVLIKGARQVGKTSLLARGLQQARQADCRVVHTDLKTFNADHLETAETLLIAIAESISEQLDLDVGPRDGWDARRGANPNFRRYLRREVLSQYAAPLVWGIDEVDRLFSVPYGDEIFALFRSWHDERALEPDGPWAKLTLAISYTSEAHLFIRDVNQSPFNVGTRLTLEDFSLAQVANLNGRYGAPLRGADALDHYFALVGGHPYLVQRGLHEMAVHGLDLDSFAARAAHADWILGDHLRRVLALLERDPALVEAMRCVLEGQRCPSYDTFYRLRSAGMLVGETPEASSPRCALYAAYLLQHLS